MGEKSGVTSPEHVRCSGGKAVCGCKARAQTTRDGTARCGREKEEAVCEGWSHGRSIAASRAFGNGIRRILFGGRAGSTQLRHNAIHYAVCRPLHTFEFICCELCVLFEKILELHPLPLWGNELSVVSLFQGKKPPNGTPVAWPPHSFYSTPNSYCPSLSRMAHMVIAIMPERNATRSLGRVSRAPSPTSRW